MYETYKCDNCFREEYPFKVIHLEDKTIVCKDCFYDAQKTNGKGLMVLSDIHESNIGEEQLERKEMEFIRRIRKLAIHNKMNDRQVVRDIVKVINTLSRRLHNTLYLNVSLLQKKAILEAMTHYFYEFFPEVLPNNILDKKGFINLEHGFRLEEFHKLLSERDGHNKL